MAVSKTSFRWKKNWYLLRKRGNNFLGSQWAAGVFLIVFAAIALVLANVEATREVYHHILGTDFGFRLGGSGFSMTIEQWVNEALMAVFFLVVGLEIKREIVAGHLSDVKRATLPIAAALGGMAVPALIYLSFNAGTIYEAGWGIPMATDIAFAIGILSLLGDRVPLSLKVFLTALAIVDDLGAILVIAFFYSSQIDLFMLGLGLAVLTLMFVMNKRGVTGMWFYLVPGLAVWYMFLNSGVHATISGVLIAAAIPTRPRFSKKYFSYKVKYFLEEFKFHNREDKEVITNEGQFGALRKIKFVTKSAASPAQRLESSLNPFVLFFVMPVFALVNAGVEITTASDLHIFSTGQGKGIYFGLLLGKPIGILLFCWLTIKTKLAKMPEGGTWGTLFGVACLGGIGFTMSIFIDCLAFCGTPYVDSGKIAVLMASVTSAIVGIIIINIFSKRNRTAG